MKTQQTLVVGKNSNPAEYFLRAFDYPTEGATDEAEMRECIKYVSESFEIWQCGYYEVVIDKIFTLDTLLEVDE